MKKLFCLLSTVFILISCNEKKIDVTENEQQATLEDIGKEFITENINILIDSIEVFDMSKISRPEKFKHIKIEKIKVDLLYCISFENNQNQVGKFLNFNIDNNNLKNFKSEYKIKLVKVNNYDSTILFVSFSNFKIKKDDAVTDVKKVIGISMRKNRCYFKRENNQWVLIKKELIGLG